MFGCGGVGDGAIAGSALAGASPIIAIDIDDRKLEWAKEFGATHTCNSTTTDPVEYVKSVTGGFGADVCIEAIGNPKVYRQAFDARDLAGTVVLVGVPRPDDVIELPFIEVFGRGGALKSSWYGDCLPSRDFPMLIDLYRQGRLDLDRFVSEEIALDDVEEAFHKMERGEVLRSVVVPVRVTRPPSGERRCEAAVASSEVRRAAWLRADPRISTCGRELLHGGDLVGDSASVKNVSCVASANSSSPSLGRQLGAVGGVGEADRRVGRPLDDRRLDVERQRRRGRRASPGSGTRRRRTAPPDRAGRRRPSPAGRSSPSTNSHEVVASLDRCSSSMPRAYAWWRTSCRRR